ncbi:MAG: amidohydrolase, partial [Lentisphaeria bacterium]|nr:amidohydrolase [Lentisphaeria bacterium]
MQTDDIIKEITPEIILLRHKLHSIPEIAGKEFKTCAEIRKFLSGVPHLETASPFLETDTVSMLYGRTPGKNVTLRADIDALELAEQSGAEYSSEHPGFAHSCGHDAH